MILATPRHLSSLTERPTLLQMLLLLSSERAEKLKKDPAHQNLPESQALRAAGKNLHVHVRDGRVVLKDD